MSNTFARGLSMAAIVSLAACGGGTGNVVPHSALPASKESAPVSFTMTWPDARVASSTRSPKFISPSTQSVAVEVNGGQPQFFNKPASGNISTLSILAPVGTDDFVFTLWDGQNGAGEELGQAEVSATIKAGKNNVINVEIAGVVAKVVVAPTANQSNVQVATDGTFGIVGDTSATFTLTPEDADNNVIIYPANDSHTPLLGLTSLETKLSVQPVSGNPNQFVVKPAGVFAHSTVSLQAIANDDFGVTTTNYPLVEVPVTYVTWQNAGAGTIKAYDTAQHPMTLSGNFPGVVNPVGIAYDSVDHLIFVADATAGGGEILAFDQQGNAAPGFVAPAVPGISALTYASNAGEIFATVGSTNKVFAFTPQGASVALSTSSFSSLQTPVGIDYDSANGQIFVANARLNYDWFFYTNTSAGPPPVWSLTSGAANNLTGAAPAGIAVDAADGLIVQTFNTPGLNDIVSYEANGSAHYTPVTGGLNAPMGVTFNAVAKEFYVANNAGNNVTGYIPNANTGQLTYDASFQIVDPTVTQPSDVMVVF